MTLWENVWVVHMKCKDGYPFCWPISKTGVFEATNNEAEVNCRSCINHMRD